MLLAVDIGNTQTHLGAFEGEELIEHWRFQTRSGATGDELGERIAGFFNLSEMHFREIDAVVVSSVVPPLGSQFERMTERYLEADCLTIGPGVEIALTALIDRAARITRIDLGEPETAIGRSTRAAINSGFIYGFAGMIDGIVKRFETELPEPKLLATGGLASAIVPFCQTIDQVDDLLTLKGLRLIYERNES